MLSRLAQQRAGAHAALLRRRIGTVARRSTSESPAATQPPRRQPVLPRPQLQQRRTLVSAPKPGDGPLMERRPDRELPSLDKITFRWSRTLPLFAAVIALASVAIFNYQKLSSPVVGATLYALRTSPAARARLGDEIYFAQQIPWISGEMNQLHGRINIRFRVKGTRGHGVMRFASNRPSPRGQFETTEWSLETEDGEVIDLLEEGDPFKAIAAGGSMGGGDGIELEEEEEEDVKVTAATRGFRK